MAYRHFGRSGDIWKHLPLAQILHIERPATYIETNAAYATYQLEHTPELEYGVFRLMAHRTELPQIAASRYVHLLTAFNHGDALRTYPGSAVQALALLGEWAGRMVFYDLDPDAVASLERYIEVKGKDHLATVRCEDSIDAAWAMIDTLGPSAFIHFDPYLVLQPGPSGRSYLDCFIKAAAGGVRAALWYGFMTRPEQKRIRAALIAALKEARVPSTKVHAMELHLARLGEVLPPFNPGIAGCGLAVANLRGSSIDAMEVLGRECEALYRGARYADRFEADQVFAPWFVNRPR